MSIPADYEERVYAGVLGKLIGVYLGRPFEGWSYERITERLSEVQYFVHERLGAPLIVTDDDISGTFTFLRALPDHGNRRDLTAREIGRTWLNYIIENQTILWWGGMGNSTEHTAFLRLKSGIDAPESGSIRRNGKTVAEQIGAQIFIDGWAMVAPGDPELAADLARRAASVSHDGEAVYAAQVIAAMEAHAFVERDLGKLLDTAAGLIPRDSVIYRLIADLRDWRETDGDWRRTRARVVERYGYDRYIGNCHVVPNHAVVLLALLYGDDDFQHSLMVANTAGWDTDCNSGNVGCLMGIKNGVAGIDAGPDWRGPVADRMYLSTADGGRAITDAVREAYEVVAIGRALAGEPAPPPKAGARYHFDLPGAVQGFRPEESPETRDTATLENVPGHSESGRYSLAIRYHGLAPGRAARVATPTFTPPEARKLGGYGLIACPTLYPGQKVRAHLSAGAGNTGPVDAALHARCYGAEDALTLLRSPARAVSPGAAVTLEWTIPPAEGRPIFEVGIELTSPHRASGSLFLDALTWDGPPDTVFQRLASGEMWRRAWVSAADRAEFWGAELVRLMQGAGTGLLIQGTREWRDYEVSAVITPRLAEAAGIAACVQGRLRYVALLLCRDGKARLVRVLDGETVLAEADFPWSLDETYTLALETVGAQLSGRIDGREVVAAMDERSPLQSGAVALVCREGRLDAREVRVRPVENGG